MVNDQDTLRVEIFSKSKGTNWWHVILQALLGEWPQNSEKAEISVAVFDASGRERSRIPARSLLHARRLRRDIEKRAATLTAAELDDWNSRATDITS